MKRILCLSVLFWLLFNKCSITSAYYLINTPNNEDQESCESCNPWKSDLLNVHLIAHTHDDVGWLKTVDQYYYGSNNYIQKAGVQYILDTVVQALAADPERRFTYVEMAFFTRWWRAQSPKIKELVSRLVKSGRLQFALGAWSMADEATVHYSDAIDQMTRGHDTLKRLFGDCGIPRVSWQIDPFGHSRDHAEIFRDSALDAVFFQRMDYREKLARRASKSMEVLWDTSIPQKDTSPGLFTSMFYDSYCYPATFCFDEKCYDPPIQDDPEMTGYNVNERVNQFLDYVNRVRQSFATNHIMVLMGCDFTYENANTNFKNTDKLIKYVNARQEQGSRINLLYSTPHCYTLAVNEAFNKSRKIERRRGDFFPYASGPFSYWTGFYTSRPALKGFIRQASTLLTMCEQINVFANRVAKSSNHGYRDPKESMVDKLRQALGVMQHHDAVTGTEKQHVADDYALTLSVASKSCQAVIADAMFDLIPNLRSMTGGEHPAFCDLLNISFCEATEGWRPYLNARGEGGVYIFVYNPTGWNLWSSWIRVPIYIDQAQITSTGVILKDLRDISQKLLPYQLLPITDRTLQIPERKSSQHLSNMEILFNIAAAGPPASPTGFTTFYLALKQLTPPRSSDSKDFTSCSGVARLSQTTTLSLIRASGEFPVVIRANHLQSGTDLNITVALLYYFGETSGPQASGAYVFLPKNSSLIQKFPDPTVNFVKGACVEEAHLTYSTWASLVVRLYSDGDLEVEWTAGPVPDSWNQFSRELIVRYTVHGEGLRPKTSGEFFTDSSGRRLIRRVRNQRPDWNTSLTFVETQPVAGNYYPIINRIMLKGSAATDNSVPAMGFAVYTDRAQGASSLRDGQVEIMLHRRLVRDDGYGVGEPLMEQGSDSKGLIVRGRHHLRLDELVIIEKEDPVASRLLTRTPVVSFAPVKQPPSSPVEWNALNISLPAQLHLLSLVAWPLLRSTARRTAPDQLLVRFEHLIPENGLSLPSEPYQLDVTYLFKGIRIIGAKEYTLTADQEKELAEAQRLRWPTENPNEAVWSHGHYVVRSTDDIILFLPLGSISTFILDYEHAG
ncbi:hypothetical protein CRM22_008433 [Opisthorchis felineus]|uniref:Alpha-mannosidase n=1 Tax=Opisthorchis felineus TaxID=147828 RepID=A0A4S2LB87_OPIFE|nr:hypothetical protein CRM22_008433 [Opisthorchis felineus]